MRTFEIIRTSLFDRKILKITGSFTQLFEIDFAIDWALTKDQDQLNEKVKDDYYIWVTNNLPYGIPQLRILYKINTTEENIILIDLDVK